MESNFRCLWMHCLKNLWKFHQQLQFLGVRMMRLPEPPATLQILRKLVHQHQNGTGKLLQKKGSNSG